MMQCRSIGSSTNYLIRKLTILFKKNHKIVLIFLNKQEKKITQHLIYIADYKLDNAETVFNQWT